MDPTGCPPGFYTDRAFQVVPVNICDTPIWLYWFLTLSVSFLRIITFGKKFFDHLKKAQENSVFKPTLSLIFHFFAGISYLIVSICVGLNVANVENGISFSLYSIAYLTFIFNYSNLLIRTVRLGERLIPHDARFQDEFRVLRQFSSIGILLFLFQVSAAVVSSIVLIILSPISPNRDQLFGVIGFAGKGVFQILCIFGICFQFQRCIALLKKFRLKFSTVSPPASGSERDHKLIHLIRNMRQKQIVIGIIGFGVSIIYLLFAGSVVHWTWLWIIIGTAGPETAGVFLLEFFFRPFSKRNTENSSNRRQSYYHNERHDEEDDDQFTDEIPQNSRIGLIGRRIKKRFRPTIDLSRVSEEPSGLSTSSMGRGVSTDMGFSTTGRSFTAIPEPDT